MQSNFLMRTSSHPPRADKSAVIDINLRTVEFRLGEQLTGIGFAPARVDASATQRLHAVGDDALQGQQTCKAQRQAGSHPLDRLFGLVQTAVGSLPTADEGQPVS